MSLHAGGKLPLSVVIAARNESDEIAACITSVAWAREIIVVENDSTDDTVEKARAAGATVFTHPFRTIGAQRNAAIERATEAWILVVDADERGTLELRDEIQAILSQVNASYSAAYRAPRRNFFMGREIRHGGWERDRPVRLFRRSMRYDERPVHEHVLTGGEAVGVLRAPLLHTPYATLEEYFEKLVRYSRWWAQQAHAAGRRCSLGDLLVRPPARVFSMLVLRGGWRGKYVQLWGMGRGRESARAGEGGGERGGAAAGGGSRGAPPISIS